MNLKLLIGVLRGEHVVIFEGGDYTLRHPRWCGTSCPFADHLSWLDEPPLTEGTYIMSWDGSDSPSYS